MRSYAHKGNRCQKSRNLWDVLTVLPAIVALPTVIFILLTAVLAIAVYAAANLVLAVIIGAWREVAHPDPYATGPYSMAGIDRGDVKRFHTALMGVCQDMARAAAKADLHNLGEGTDQ